MTEDLRAALVAIEQTYARHGHGPLAQWGRIVGIDVSTLSTAEVCEAVGLAYGADVLACLRRSGFENLVQKEVETLLGADRARAVMRKMGQGGRSSGKLRARSTRPVLLTIVAVVLLVAAVATGLSLSGGRDFRSSRAGAASDAAQALPGQSVVTPRDQLVTASFALVAVSDCDHGLDNLERNVLNYRDQAELREMVTGSQAPPGDPVGKQILRREMIGRMDEHARRYRANLSELNTLCRRNGTKLAELDAMLSNMRADLLPAFRACSAYLESVAVKAGRAREDGTDAITSGLPNGDQAERLLCLTGFRDRGVTYENRHLILSWDPSTIPREGGLVGDLSLGSANAPVHVTETTNFVCPSCRASWEQNMPAIRALAASGKIFYTLKESFPERRHDGDETPDDTISFFVTARCLGSAEAYWKGLDTLYSTPVASHGSIDLEREGTAPLYRQTCVEGIADDFLKRAQPINPSDTSLPRFNINGVVFSGDAATRGIHALMQEAASGALAPAGRSAPESVEAPEGGREDGPSL